MNTGKRFVTGLLLLSLALPTWAQDPNQLGLFTQEAVTSNTQAAAKVQQTLLRRQQVAAALERVVGAKAAAKAGSAFAGIASLSRKMPKAGWWTVAIVIGSVILPELSKEEPPPPPKYPPYTNGFESRKDLEGWTFYNGVSKRQETVGETEEEKSSGGGAMWGQGAAGVVLWRKITGLFGGGSEEKKEEAPAPRPRRITDTEEQTIIRRDVGIIKVNVSSGPPTMWDIDGGSATMPGKGFYEGKQSLNFNDPVTNNYDVYTRGSKVSSGYAFSPVIDIRLTHQPVALFMCNYETGYSGSRQDPKAAHPPHRRSVAVGAVDSMGKAQFPLEVDLGTDPNSFFTVRDAGLCAAPGVWHMHMIELKPWWGEVYLSFHFDSQDNADNRHRGWFIDNMQVIDLKKMTPEFLQQVDAALQATIPQTIPATGGEEMGFDPASLTPEQWAQLEAEKWNKANTQDNKLQGEDNKKLRENIEKLLGASTEEKEETPLLQEEAPAEPTEKKDETPVAATEEKKEEAVVKKDETPVIPPVVDVPKPVEVPETTEVVKEEPAKTEEVPVVTSSTTETKPVDTVVYRTTFDSPEAVDGWTPQNFQMTAVWGFDGTPAEVEGKPFFSAPNSLNYNNGRNYETGSANRGYVTSPEIDLSGLKSPRLLFRCNYETEAATLEQDQRWIQISNQEFKGEALLGGQFGTFSVPDDLLCTNSGEWHLHQIDLSPAWGKVQVRFIFDSVNGSENGFAGWFIDDFEVVDRSELENVVAKKASGKATPAAKKTAGSTETSAKKDNRKGLCSASGSESGTGSLFAALLALLALGSFLLRSSTRREIR